MSTVEVKVEDLDTLATLTPLQPGDEGYTDPDLLEKKLLAEEAARRNKAVDPEEMACMMLKLYTPRFNKLVDGLPKRACSRLIKALVEYPLGKEYHHTTDKEAEAFSIGSALMDAKMVLIVKTYHDNRDTINELVEEAAANATFEYGDKAEALMNEDQKGSN